MIKFAFCYEHDDTLSFVKNEVQNCLRQREIEISVLCCHNACELAQRAHSGCPDILFCDLAQDGAPLRSAIMNVKRANNRLICVSTAASHSAHAEDILLEPLSRMPSSA